MQILTMKIMTKAIKNKLGINEPKAKKIASFVMDAFGYELRIIDNILKPDERQLFYMLEAEGFMTTGRERTRLHDGREWMTHYWHLQHHTIYSYAQSNPTSLLLKQKEKIKQKLTPQNIYSTLSEDIWFTRKIGDHKAI
jgi:uncharacterized protein DUF6015